MPKYDAKNQIDKNGTYCFIWYFCTNNIISVTNISINSLFKIWEFLKFTIKYICHISIKFNPIWDGEKNKPKDAAVTLATLKIHLVVLYQT